MCKELLILSCSLKLLNFTKFFEDFPSFSLSLFCFTKFFINCLPNPRLVLYFSIFSIPTLTFLRFPKKIQIYQSFTLLQLYQEQSPSQFIQSLDCLCSTFCLCELCLLHSFSNFVHCLLTFFYDLLLLLLSKNINSSYIVILACKVIQGEFSSYLESSTTRDYL